MVKVRARASRDASSRDESMSDASSPEVRFNRGMTAARRSMLRNSRFAHLLPKSALNVRSPSIAKSASSPVVKDKRVKKVSRPVLKSDSGVGLQSSGSEDKSDHTGGVIYLGHIPHGFYEREMRAYFSQFGAVTCLRLSRSRRTARSRGYAFIQFASADVAHAAAEAMDGYLMHGRSLVARMVPPERLHEHTFRGANRQFKKVPWAALERSRNLRAANDPQKLKKRAVDVVSALKKRQNTLKNAGIDYKFPQPLTPAPVPPPST